MVAKHIGLALIEQRRARWVRLIALAADDAELPAMPHWGWGEAPPYQP